MTRKLNLVLIYKKKGTCHKEDFTVPEDPTEKIKKNKTIKKYSDFGRDWCFMVYQSFWVIYIYIYICVHVSE